MAKQPTEPSKLKHYEIQHRKQGVSIEIKTDWTVPEALESLLFSVAREINSRKPERLEWFVRYMQTSMELVKKDRNKAKMPVLDEEDHPDSFEWWRQLMETPPPGVGGGHY